MALQLHIFPIVLLFTALSQVPTCALGQLCEVGRELAPIGTSSAATTGQYLDLNHPATCDGQLTGLSLCYPSSSMLSEGLFLLVLRVWRKESDQMLHMVREVQITVQVSDGSNSDDDLQQICGNSGQFYYIPHVELRSGDVLGVLLPKSDLELLPVVINATKSAGLYADTRESSDSDSPLAKSDLELRSDLALNLHAHYVGPAPALNSTGVVEDVLRPSPSPAASPYHTALAVSLRPLTTPEPRPTRSKVRTSSQPYFPLYPSRLPTITPSVDAVSASMPISTYNLKVVTSPIPVRSSLPTDAHGSISKILMATPLLASIHRSLTSLHPSPTLTHKTAISIEPGLKFSRTLTENTATFKPILPGALTRSFLGAATVIAKTQPSALLTQTVRNDITATLSLSEFSLLSLGSTSVQNTLASTTLSVGHSSKDHMTLSKMPAPTLTVSQSKTAVTPTPTASVVTKLVLALPITPSSLHTELPPDLSPTPSVILEELALTESLITVIIAVCILFATLSGCIMLSCTFFVHCRKITRVEQVARRNIESNGTSYTNKHLEESINNLPLLVEISSEGPNLLNTSLESAFDNTSRNSPYTERDSSQLAAEVATPPRRISPAAVERAVELIELDDVKVVETRPKVPPRRCRLQRSHTIEVVPVILNARARAPTSAASACGARHDYDEPLAKKYSSKASRYDRVTLIRPQEYEDPAILNPRVLPPQKQVAGGYEEPITSSWRRTSMPSLATEDPSDSLAHMEAPRRNSLASELFMEKKKPQSRAKPGMILHYAEFSLIPPNSTATATSTTTATTLGAAGDASCDRSATSAPSTQHEYEELPLLPPIFQPPPSVPIPAPIRLLKGAGGYEVPITKSPLPPKPPPPTILLNKMKLKLDHISSDSCGRNLEEDEERLIESETESRDTIMDSPGNETISSQETNNELANTLSTMDGAYFFPASKEEELADTLKKLSIEVIPSNSIESKLTNEQVQHGVWRKDVDSSKFDVTLKTLDSTTANSKEETLNGSEVSAVARLLQEAVIMRQFRHPNILRLHGVVYEDRHSVLVSEHFPRGDLRKILVQMGRSVVSSDTAKLLLTYSQQVALGMQYLASKGFVHRDLCARNVFVTVNDICKVGGFGKSRDLTDVNNYISRGGRIQIRWTAPEAIYYHQYSTASDVWSYGCLLYEIWSLGRMPFRDCSNAEVMEKVDSGHRLPPPPGCPRAIYDLMIRCWHPNPFSRPCFKDILNCLLQDERVTLYLPRRDAATHQSAEVLGASLKSSLHMYGDLQQRYAGRGGLKGHDYDHIEEEEFMLAFPTSSADLACDVRSKKNEGGRNYDEEEEEEEEESSEDVSGGVSSVPQPSLYSAPLEGSRATFAIPVLSTNHFFEL